MNSTIAAALSVAVLSACGTTVVYAPLSRASHPLAARASSTVEVYENAPPERPYVVVGTVEARPDSMYADTRLTPKLVAEMRDEAARMGCDALVMQGSAPAPASTLGGRAIASVSYRGSCVVFSAPTAVVVSAPTASR